MAITPNADASFSSPIACDVQDPDGAHLNSKIDHEEEGRGEGGQQTEDLPLCKADAILARALLCPAGAAYVFSMTRRRRKRAERAAVSDAGALCTGGRGEERERDAPAAERGDLSWVTVEQGVWAAQRVVEELTAWKRGQARGKGESDGSRNGAGGGDGGSGGGGGGSDPGFCLSGLCSSTVLLFLNSC